MQINDTVTVDDLVLSYLRFRDWMDHDAEHSAYCAKEIFVMQTLFETAYIKIPPSLLTASHEELLACMEKRQVTLRRFTDAIHTSANEDEIHDLLAELQKSTFKSEVHYFTTLFEAVLQTAESVSPDDEQEPLDLALDGEPLEDHFSVPDEAAFETIRAFIVAEHPRTKSMSFPAERLYSLGLPRLALADPLR